MASFENLHPTKAWAFTDGLLTGILVAGTYFTYRLAVKNDSHQAEVRRLRNKISVDETFENSTADALKVVSYRTPWSTDLPK